MEKPTLGTFGNSVHLTQLGLGFTIIAGIA
jgi:hypothetical protein